MRRYCKNAGDAGEEFVAKMLEDSGYTILESNFRTRMGEIDIIAIKDSVLHIIEVKTRTGFDYGYPSDAVTESKQKTIRKCADFYISRRKILWNRVSMDVAEVTFNLIEDCM